VIASLIKVDYSANPNTKGRDYEEKFISRMRLFEKERPIIVGL